MCINNSVQSRRNSANIVPSNAFAWIHKEVPIVPPKVNSSKVKLNHYCHRHPAEETHRYEHEHERKPKPLLPGFTAKHHVRHFVQHNYHDHSTDPPSPGDVTDANMKGGVAVPFPLKLHEMLEKIDEDGLAPVVSWQPHGRAFVVHKPEEFVAKIMPKYFKQTKLSSFQRQLNLYGFCRITRGPDRGGYYHELFLQGRPWLCYRMARTRVKGTGVRTASSPDTEPNFYTMPSVPPFIPVTEEAKPPITRSIDNTVIDPSIFDDAEEPERISSSSGSPDQYFDEALDDLLKEIDLPFEMDDNFSVPECDIEFGALLDKLVE